MKLSTRMLGFILLGTACSLPALAQELAVRHGVVTSMVKITEGPDNRTASTGRTLGATVGGYTGRITHSVLGAAIGTNVGSLAGDKASHQLREKFYRVTIRQSNGREFAVTQKPNNVADIHVGNHVQVTGTGANAIITKE